jgi:glycine/D-amino acid oxidase-like deaminating enzyme
LSLQARNHQVTLVDPGPLPHELAASTDISKLIRADYGADGFFADLGRQAIAGWEDWNLRPGRRLYHPDGILVISRQPIGPGGFEGDSWRTLRARGWPLIRLDSDMLRQRHPQWTLGDDADGYVNIRAGWAESGQVVARLLTRAQGAGIELLQGVRMLGVELSAGRVSGIATNIGPMSAQAVVVAAGAWTPSLLPWLADRLWATGHPVLHFRPPDPMAWRAPRHLPWAADISRTGFYGFPANAEGVVKIANHGAGIRLEPDDPREVPPETEAHFRAFLAAALPELADVPLVGHRLCLYCDTFDGDFWIGADPDRPGLVVASGGAGHGFKFAPVLGGLIADAVQGTPGPWAHRFGWRQRGELRTEHARQADRHADEGA